MTDGGVSDERFKVCLAKAEGAGYNYSSYGERYEGIGYWFSSWVK